jgi:hypothetical protein
MSLLTDAAHFVSTFGETVTYRPAGGGTRQIKAVVERAVPGALGAAPHGQAPVKAIGVINSDTSGISGAELDIGGDRVDIADKVGGTAQTRPIVEQLTADSGMLRLRVR